MANTETCFIFTTCGTQHSATDAPPSTCDICTDERQYIHDGGQQWTALSRLRQAHRNGFRRLEPALLGIGTEPSFAIGQRFLFIQNPGGNVLWDCIALIDDATIDIVHAMGGPRARDRARVAPFQFDRIYGGWWGKHVDQGAAAALRESAERYIRHSTTPAGN